jgi:hypothetical protein
LEQVCSDRSEPRDAERDTSSAADTSTAVDSGMRVDSGTVLDSGNVTDSGNATDSGIIVDVRTVSDTGIVVDTGTDSGVTVDTGNPCPPGEMICSGACVNLLNDDAHCGGCANDCALLAHTTMTACSAGACEVMQCATDYADCDSLESNGCETNLTTASDCGACGVVCSGSSMCALQQSGGYACQATCSASTTECGNVCVDTSSNLNNCGGCGVVCPSPVHGTAECAAGSCRYTCDHMYHDCGGGVCAHGMCP